MSQELSGWYILRVMQGTLASSVPVLIVEDDAGIQSLLVSL